MQIKYLRQTATATVLTATWQYKKFYPSKRIDFDALRTTQSHFAAWLIELSGPNEN